MFCGKVVALVVVACGGDVAVAVAVVVREAAVAAVVAAVVAGVAGVAGVAAAVRKG